MLRKGRFEKSMDSEAAEYSASLKEDLRLFDAVVQINMAHVDMLEEEEIIEREDAGKLIEALSNLRDIDPEELDMPPELEDIHMVVEEYVKDEVGEEVSGKLHTAKSRNDQVTAAIRMVLREETLRIQELCINLVEEIKDLAEKHKDTIMPGYTHLQVAEPTSFAHYLTAYGQALIRSADMLNESYKQTNKSPLGSCALSGTSFPIDRKMAADLLGFDGIMKNTMDATSSRDFAIRAIFDASTIMRNLSRFAEELILYSTSEFDMLKIPEEFTSTSSIMPQKRNPVTAELTRAKFGQTIGNLAGSLNIMKALPQAYNLDLQELTPLVWDSIDQTKSTLLVMKKIVASLEANPEKMRENAENGFASLTELANTIVRETDIPFREAHNIVGKLASRALDEEKSLEDLTEEDLKAASKEILDEEIEIGAEKFEEAIDLEKCVGRRDVTGGPSPESVENIISELRDRADSLREILEKRKEQLKESRRSLEKLGGE